jgi:hypothetical protein
MFRVKGGKFIDQRRYDQLRPIRIEPDMEVLLAPGIRGS